MSARSDERASTRDRASSAWLVREYCSSPSGEFDRTSHCAATHSRQSARPFGRASGSPCSDAMPASGAAERASFAGVRAPAACRRATCSSTCRCIRSAGTYCTSRSNTVRNTASTTALVGRDISRRVGRSRTARTRANSRSTSVMRPFVLALLRGLRCRPRRVVRGSSAGEMRRARRCCVGLLRVGGRYQTRTDDLFGVNEARYQLRQSPLHCACQSIVADAGACTEHGARPGCGVGARPGPIRMNTGDTPGERGGFWWMPSGSYRVYVVAATAGRTNADVAQW